MALKYVMPRRTFSFPPGGIIIIITNTTMPRTLYLHDVCVSEVQYPSFSLRAVHVLVE